MPYVTTPTLPVDLQYVAFPLTPIEIKLIERLRQAAGQGRMIIVDPEIMSWTLCGKWENSAR